MCCIGILGILCVVLFIALHDDRHRIKKNIFLLSTY